VWFEDVAFVGPDIDRYAAERPSKVRFRVFFFLKAAIPLSANSGR
jgi:hypothetical protein